MAIESSLYPAIAALAGSFIIMAGNIVNTYLQRKSEERKAIKQLVINAAIESYKQHFEIAKLYREEGKSSPLLTIDEHMIRMMLFSDITLNEKITFQNIDKKIQDMDLIANKLINSRYKEIIQRHQ